MEGAIDARTLWAGPLELHRDAPLALAGGRPVALSAREFGLLRELASRPNRIITRVELYGAIWGAPGTTARRRARLAARSSLRSTVRGA